MTAKQSKAVKDSKEKARMRKTTIDPFHKMGLVKTIFGPIDPGQLFGLSKKELGGINTGEKLLLMTARQEHTVVTDRDDKRVHRQMSIRLPQAQHFSGGEEVLRHCCRSLYTLFWDTLYEHPVFLSRGNQIAFPNFIFVLGEEARVMAMEIAECALEYSSVGNQKQMNKMHFVVLMKEVNSRGVLVSFKLSDCDRNYALLLKKKGFRSKVYGIIVDDAALTLRSVDLAKEFLESFGVNLLGALVMFNQYEEKWPRGLSPIQVALANLSPFEKFTDLTCPVCEARR